MMFESPFGLDKTQKTFPKHFMFMVLPSEQPLLFFLFFVDVSFPSLCPFSSPFSSSEACFLFFTFSPCSTAGGFSPPFFFFPFFCCLASLRSLLFSFFFSFSSSLGASSSNDPFCTFTSAGVSSGVVFSLEASAPFQIIDGHR